MLLAEVQGVEEIEQLREAVAELSEVEANDVMGFLNETLIPGAIGIAWEIFVIAIIYFVGMRLIRISQRTLKAWLERAEVDIGIIQFLDSAAKIGLYCLLFVAIISRIGNFGVSLAAIVGSAGIAIGLALQGSLSNIAGGVLILLLKPFSVGDYIIEDTGQNEGTVKEIQMFYTKLVTADNKVIVIPNGTLSNSSLTNVTDLGKRRLDLFVGIGYQADLRQAKQVLTDILQHHEAVMKEEDINVFVDALDDSSVKLGIRAWVPTDQFWKAKWDINEKIKLEFDRHGIEIPFNQLDVNVNQAK